MATGTVKWFNSQKGYGFVVPDEGGKDVFLHITALEKIGMKHIDEGAKISYELKTDKGRTSADNIAVM